MNQSGLSNWLMFSKWVKSWEIEIINVKGLEGKPAPPCLTSSSQEDHFSCLMNWRKTCNCSKPDNQQRDIFIVEVSAG